MKSFNILQNILIYKCCLVLRYIIGISLIIRRDLKNMWSRGLRSSILDHFLNVGCGMVNEEDLAENI